MNETNLEQRPRSPYRQFAAGNNLCFTLNKLRSDGSVETADYNAPIKAIKGGGFFGQVLILEGLPFVLKAAIPADPWHDFWRRVNWGAKDFPYQVSEFDAQLGHVKTNLIHDAISAITKDGFYAPASFGYTQLPGTFAQAVERLHGRPPRYDNGGNEFLQFRQAQTELADIAYRLGLEHVGQIHPDNPFAMANIWLNPPLQRWEWFDTLPAIPHNGWIWPGYHFGFHHEIRETFYRDTKTVTFDRIHTDRFREAIENNKALFNEETYGSIQDTLSLYEKLMQEREYEGRSPRNFRGLATSAKESVVDLGQTVVNMARGVMKIPSVDELVLNGARKALNTGTITEMEFQEAVSSVQDFSRQERGRNRFWRALRGFSFWTGLYAYYQGSSSLLKVPEITAYTSVGLYVSPREIIGKVMSLDVSSFTTQEDWLAKSAILLGIFLGFRAAGSLNSYLATKLIGRLAGRNLDTAARISAIPVIGTHLAIPAQLCADQGNKNKAIWHYTVRRAVAKVSGISPAGGWGSQLEGKLWNMFGKRLEGLADNRRSKSLNKRFKDRLPDKFLAIFHH